MQEKPLTLFMLAMELRKVVKSPEELAVTIKQVYDRTGNSITALNLCGCLLHSEIYPELNIKELSAILQKIGYQMDEINDAVQILTPIKFTVDARLSWQDTGVTVKVGEQVTITYIFGEWGFNTNEPSCGPYGSPYLFAKEGYTLPDAHEGALIGKIADKLFVVDESIVLSPFTEGKLYLAINDDLDARYGAGLSDNWGSIEVGIQKKRI